MREQSRNTRFEYLAADKGDVRMALGLEGKMLAPTKTDLEPNRPLGSAESNTGFQPPALGNGHGKSGQQFADSGLLGGTKAPPAAAPKDQLTLCQLHDWRNLEGAPKLVREIEPLPGEAAVGFGLPTEMAIGRRARVDRSIQTQMHADAAR